MIGRHSQVPNDVLTLDVLRDHGHTTAPHNQQTTELVFEGQFSQIEEGHRREYVDYYQVQEEKGRFSDASTLDPLYRDHKGKVESRIRQMMDDAVRNGLPNEKQTELRQTVIEHTDEFRTSFSLCDYSQR